MQKEIPSQLIDGDSVNLVLSGVPSEANRVQLCVVDRVRERVATFSDLKLTPKCLSARATPCASRWGAPM